MYTSPVGFAATLWWACGKVAALFSILAAVGVEAVYLFLFTFIILAIRAAKDMKGKKATESAEA